MNSERIVKEVFGLSDRVRQEAQKLNKLPGAALAAVVGGSVVVGVVGGGLFWAPAAMAGCMFLYRATVTAIQYRSYRHTLHMSQVSEVLKQLEAIDESPLPSEFKWQLSNSVLAVLPASHPTVSSLPALEDKSTHSQSPTGK